MLEVSPLWPAELDHIRLDSPAPAALAAFYCRTMGMVMQPLGGDAYWLQGKQRRLVIGPGTIGSNPYNAFALGDHAQLARYRDYVAARGVELLPCPTPLFEDHGFAVRDPDDRLVVFGLARPSLAPADTVAAANFPGRLQHVVVASSRFAQLMAFYRDALGFMVSDIVHTGAEAGPPGETNVCFLRTNVEHHSFAAFRAPQSAGDHHCYETTGWGDIKLWADHFADQSVAIWWGPGRHGAGNNLFFMVKDPDGNNIEISAELEHLARGEPGKTWPAGGRAINLWGKGWDRDVAAP